METPYEYEKIRYMTRVVILIPTYNESESVLRLVDRIAPIRQRMLLDSAIEDLDLLFIDDNSPDGTAEMIESRQLSWASVLRRSTKAGLGPAYIAGFRQALLMGYDFLVEMDADLSHQPEALPDLLAPVLRGDADLTIGTRWMPGGKVVNWPLSRQMISRVGTGYARLALGLKLRDVTSGYRVFRSTVIQSIDLNRIEAQGYGFQIEMVLRTLQNGFKVEEVPITFVEREGGVSKMSRRIVFEALWKVTLWGVRRVLFRR